MLICSPQRVTVGILNALKCLGKTSEPEQKNLVKGELRYYTVYANAKHLYIPLAKVEICSNEGCVMKPPPQNLSLLEYESNTGAKSFVERVFGGELTSTVMCTECETVSVITEMFLDLSLPVADEVKS